MIEIAIVIVLIAVLGGIFFYLKRKKVLEKPSTLQNSDVLPDSGKTAETPKSDAAPAAEKMVVSAAAQTVSAETPSPAVTAEASTEASEEDHMLRRHHLHNIRLMLMATTFPQPTDSTLSRHYDEMIDAKAEDCLNDEAKMAKLVAEYEACQNAQILEDSAATVQANVATPESKECCHHKRCVVPEDSALRRHYLSTLRANIEKNKAPRPTDSALRRHYDAMINAEIENHLACS